MIRPRIPGIVREVAPFVRVVDVIVELAAEPSLPLRMKSFAVSVTTAALAGFEDDDGGAVSRVAPSDSEEAGASDRPSSSGFAGRAQSSISVG